MKVVLTSALCLVARSRRLEQLAAELEQPGLLELLRRFLHDALRPELEPAVDVDLDDCPELSPRTRIALYHSAATRFDARNRATTRAGCGHPPHVRNRLKPTQK